MKKVNKMAAPMVAVVKLHRSAARFLGSIAPFRSSTLFIFPTSYLNGPVCFSSNANNLPVRVRFAPSPTGFLHLGGLRTALYNFLFARSGKGSFIVRIEDTDQSRAIPGAVDKLIDALHWAGLVPDEGPETDNAYGPYTQSERLPIYKENIKTLLENRWAYPCFCTARRLELMRKDAIRRGEPTKYDNRCRNLPPEQVQELLRSETPYVVRLKLEPTPDPWDDLIKGPLVHNLEDIEGDPILIKSDGFPTYHFANVVDDHLMEITHVLRGSEWLSSTPKHILLYKAFGWHPPKFGHLPLIMNADGSKLSKRQGDVHIDYFREAGYLPQAVLNYITTIGGGFGQSTVAMSLKEMCETFDVSLVHRNPGRLDSNWLQAANREILQQCVDESTDPQVTAELIQQIRSLVIDTYGDRLGSNHLKEQVLSNEYIQNVVRWTLMEDRTSTLKDFIGPQLAYLWVTPNPDTYNELTTIDLQAGSYISACLELAKESESFTVEFLTTELKSIMKEHNAKAKIFFQVMRMALTGLKQGAPLAEMMAVVGRENVILRLDAALKALDQS